jgi:hypothetical protein
MILKLMPPALWLSIIMVAWGVVMTLMGIVQSYGGLIAARFCLGIAEVHIFLHVLADTRLTLSGWPISRRNLSPDLMVSAL